MVTPIHSFPRRKERERIEQSSSVETNGWRRRRGAVICHRVSNARHRRPCMKAGDVMLVSSASDDDNPNFSYPRSVVTFDFDNQVCVRYPSGTQEWVNMGIVVGLTGRVGNLVRAARPNEVELRMIPRGTGPGGHRTRTSILDAALERPHRLSETPVRWRRPWVAAGIWLAVPCVKMDHGVV